MRRFPAMVAAVVSLALLWPAAALAAPTDAPILVRSLAPGSVESPAHEFVMVQMTVPGQNQVEGSELILYGPDGNPTEVFVLPDDVPVGVSHSTILFANQGTPFLVPDFELSPEDNLDPAAGAVCFTGSYPADCASWGSFPGSAALPDPQLHNAEPIAANPFGYALGRPLTHGCTTWLDPTDDSDNSNRDFFDGVPGPPLFPGGPPAFEPFPEGPRNNSSAGGEEPCPPQDTVLNERPKNPTNQATVRFAFGESPPDYGTVFMCSFEGAPYSACSRSDNLFGPLVDGYYTLQVYAITQGGEDATPASWTWEVDTVPPNTSITQTPGQISNGFSASFAFASSEQHPTFVCRLDNGPKQTCEPGKTFFFLADGYHTFRVWASDQATNQDPTPAEHTFLVDGSFGDTLGPFTSITSGPPRHAKAASASFTYTSNEPGSRFECRVDGEAFSPCDAGRTRYPGLRNGRRVFQVRAIDRAGNADLTPEAYAWTIEGVDPETRITEAPPGVRRLKKGRTRVRFAFSSSRPNSEFACRLDKGRFRPCQSPMRLGVGLGRHTFEVYAIDALGNRDPSPARRIFRLIRRGRAKGIFGSGDSSGGSRR